MEAQPIVDTQAFTSYTEAVGEMETGVERSNYSVLPPLNTFPETDIVSALKRPYRVSEFTWDSSDVLGTLLYTGEFPYDLIQLPFLADKLRSFGFMRTKVKLEFKFNSTKFEYGALLLSWLPFYSPSGLYNWRLGNIYSMSQCNPIVISAQQGTSVSIELPWINQDPWMTVDSPLPEVGTVAIRVLHSLVSASADPPPAINVSVYASLVDPEIAGFDPSSEVSSNEFKKSMYYQPQSLSTKKTSDLRNKKEARGSGTIQKEAEVKSEKGMLTGVAEAVASYAPMVALVAPEYASVAEGVGFLAQALGPIFSSLGLNKPTSLAVSEKFVASLDAPLAFGSGLDTCSKLSLDPEQAISTAPGLCGFDDPQPTLSAIIQRPTMIAVFNFNNVASVGSDLFTTVVRPQVVATGVTSGEDPVYINYVPTYAMYYSTFFQFWRGGFNYQLRFVTSSFVTCRVRIAFQYNSYLDTSTHSGDVISKVVDISGDTTVEFFIPYLSNKMYLMCDSSEYLGLIQVTLETPVVSPEVTVAPPVFCSVWQAAAPDFRYFKFCAPSLPLEQYLLSNDPYSPPVPKQYATPQCDIVKEFSKPYEGLVPGCKLSVEGAVVNGEDPGTLNTLLHRYLHSPDTSLPSGGEQLDVFPRRPSFLNLLLYPFLFMRGSKRFYVAPPTFSSVHNVGHLQNNAIRPGSWFNGATALGGPAEAPLHFECPWYFRELFIETAPTMGGSEYYRILLDKPDNSELLECLGDDTSVGVLAACPILVVEYTDLAPAYVKFHNFRPRSKKPLRKGKK